MAAFNFHRQRTRRWWYVGATLVAVAFFTVFYVAGAFADAAGGCDFSSTDSGLPGDCLGALPGSTFAGGDGNLAATPANFGSTDWSNVAGLHTGPDLPSGQNDNSFGQGTKTDNVNVTVVNGSIPNNKSDLTRFYEASEVSSVNSHNFLYLAFERANVLGTANMNFEINQKAQPDLTTAGAKVLNRTAGDLLVTFDFNNGGGRPTIGILRWLTSASVPVVPGFSTNACFSANTFPCWGDQKTLNGSDSIAAVNNIDPVTDPLPPNAGRSLPALTFGETAIDLTAAGVFPSGICEAFGSTMVTSRSSSSFTSEVKDFVAPVPVNISNCGAITVIKHTDPRGVNQKFGYTSNLPAEPAGTVGTVPQGGVVCQGNATAGVQADGSFCLNDNGNSTSDSAGNTVYNNALQAGSYHVTEGADPSGFTFENLSCTGGTTSTSGKTATITLAPGDNVVCTYVNQQNSASIATQQSTSTGTVFPGTGVTDTATVTGSNSNENPSGTVTFYLCSGTTTGCSSTSNSIGTGTLGNGSGGVSTATSPAVNSSTPLAAGNYCFGASWPGDTNYPGALSETGATNECFTVSQIGTTTATSPSPIGGTTVFGDQTVTDSALITAAQSGGGAITGSVDFTLCSPSQMAAANETTCASGGTDVGSTTTLTDQGSDPPSVVALSAAFSNGGKGVNQTGTWCWRAVYTPNTVSNYTGSSDSRSTECFTVTDTFSSTSGQTWLPNDSATVTAAHGAPLNGTLSIQLYTGSTCDTGGTKIGSAYTKTLTNATSAADRTLATNNTTNTVSTSSSVSWLVTFTSTDSNVTGSSHCESTSLTINN